MIKVVIIGVCGKMGSALVPLLLEQTDMELVGGVEAFGHPQVDTPIGTGKIFADLAAVINHCDVCVEFTSPVASLTHAEIIARASKRYVLGTTGFTTNQLSEIENLSRIIPIVYSPNYSIGVNLLFKLVETSAQILNNDFGVEIIEIHHTQKKDAPSGTAQKLVEIIEKTTGKKKIIYGRAGSNITRSQDEIGVFAIRSGDVVGEHYVIFGQKGERLELVHKASNRLAFAQGVIKTIRFIQNKPAGFYDMASVLSDRS